MRIGSFTKALMFFLLLTVACRSLDAQGIRGEIQDANGAPVPYAAIFIRELTRGTTCNALGQFSLPLPPGEYTIFFRSLGYTEVSRTLTVGDVYTDLVIQLPPQTYMIPEVRISATGEDPAYWIMRKAIGLANYHLHEVSSYRAEIYIKGTAILDKLPKAIAKRIRANDVQVKEGEAYMLESLNEVRFTAPDKYDMRVVASQNTLPGYTDNVNPMDYINASLYEQEIEGVISPLARTAFNYYRFSFEGTFLEGTYIVNKIRVIPKRKSQQLVEGYLYIVEDLWCLHSSDLSLTTMAGTIYLQQLYANVIMDAWLPVNHKIQADLDIVGVAGSATYVSSLEYTDVVLNPNLPETYFTSILDTAAGEDVEEKEEPSREQEKINALLAKEELSNRDAARLSKLMQKETRNNAEQDPSEGLDQTGTTFTVEKDAVRNDSLYWNEMRPIPLTPEEHLTLRTRDSIMGIGSGKAASDSTTANTRAGTGGSTSFRDLALGKTWVKRKGRVRLSYGGLLDPEQLSYNTVDGISYGQSFRLRWNADSLRTVRSNLNAGYAFHRKAPLLSWDTDLLYAPLRRGKVALYLNYRSSDFNGSTGIPDRTNLVYTLFLRQNHLKMYERIDATLYNRIDLANGLALHTWAGYGRRNRLMDHSHFSIFYRNAPEERFTPNTPDERSPDAPELQGRYTFLAEMQLEYTPRNYYVIRNHRKIMRDSDWPTFSLDFRQAIPLGADGWSRFSVLEADVSHSLEAGLLSTLEWSLSAGTFLDTASVHFSDYRHFKSNPLYIDMAGLDQALMFADYYSTSTHRYWIRAQATLNSSYLLIKYLPWFSERLWREALDLAYLYHPGTRHYLQLGYNLKEVFFMVDLGVYVGFGEKDPGQDGGWGYRGVTARLNLNF